jgi:hypothetical protein
MNNSIKTRLDNIDAQMAQLKKEQEKLREELNKPEFIPRWYLIWDNNIEHRILVNIKTQETFENRKQLWDHVEEATSASLAQFLPTTKTSYNWPEIIKQYPEAQWASTDEDGRVDLWKNKPEAYSNYWGSARERHLVTGGYTYGSLTPDWADSLEKRPDYL